MQEIWFNPGESLRGMKLAYSRVSQENSMDSEAWWTDPWGCKKSDTAITQSQHQDVQFGLQIQAASAITWELIKNA